MGGEVCYQPTRERGPWYEIQCVKNDIISKEKRGEDASFERSLLRSWGKFKGWENAAKVLAEIPRRKSTKSKSKGVKPSVNTARPLEEK